MDVHSRFVVYANVMPNNRGDSVMNHFVNGVLSDDGGGKLPSRVRVDGGSELDCVEVLTGMYGMKW